jgi:hypothetical protein
VEAEDAQGPQSYMDRKIATPVSRHVCWSCPTISDGKACPRQATIMRSFYIVKLDAVVYIAKG